MQTEQAGEVKGQSNEQDSPLSGKLAELELEKAVLNAEKEALYAEAMKDGSFRYSDEEQSVLDQLLIDDPDKYYQKRRELDTKYLQDRQAQIKTGVNNAVEGAVRENELKYRDRILKDFERNNPNFNADLDGMPVSIYKELENDTITFYDALVKYNNYQQQNTSILPSNTPPSQPDMSSVGVAGSSIQKPTEQQIQEMIY